MFRSRTGRSGAVREREPRRSSVPGPVAGGLRGTAREHAEDGSLGEQLASTGHRASVAAAALDREGPVRLHRPAHGRIAP